MIENIFIRQRILEALQLARQGQAGAAKALLAGIESSARAPEIDHAWARVLTLAGEPDAAIERFRRYLRKVPQDCRARGALAALLAGQGRLGAARRELDSAISAARPEDQALILTDYGNALIETSHQAEAIAAYERAVTLGPAHPHMRLNLASALSFSGRSLAAIYHLAVAQRLDPKFIETQAPDQLENHLLALIGLAEDPERQKSNAVRLAGLRGCDVTPLPPPKPRPRREGRLRIGYVSPDFRQHAVGSFFAPVLAAHDRSKVAIHLYGEVRSPDLVTERLRNLADDWLTTCGIAADELAKHIRKDDIDILVDLAGWTGGSRLDAFFYRPARIQLTWLGYAATTGLDAGTGLDGRITDRWADPPADTEPHFTERLLRLPSGFIAYRPLTDVPLQASVPAERHGHITFGSFNNAAKISDATVDLWARVVNAVPKARLQLKNHALEDRHIRREIAARFARAGLVPERLTMSPPTASAEDHLRAYGDIDIALDTFPYHGTTTTCEALWMGAPVVSLIGSTHASRVGFSVLARAGLEDLATKTPDEFIAVAVQLAADRPRLAALRAGLRAQMCASPLFDPAQLAHELESLYDRLATDTGSKDELAKPA